MKFLTSLENVLGYDGVLPRMALKRRHVDDDD